MIISQMIPIFCAWIPVFMLLNKEALKLKLIISTISKDSATQHLTITLLLPPYFCYCIKKVVDIMKAQNLTLNHLFQYAPWFLFDNRVINYYGSSISDNFNKR